MVLLMQFKKKNEDDISEIASKRPPSKMINTLTNESDFSCINKLENSKNNEYKIINFIDNYSDLFKLSNNASINYKNIQNLKNIFSEDVFQNTHEITYKPKINDSILRSHMKRFYSSRDNNEIDESFLDGLYSRLDICGSNDHKKLENLISILWNNLILFSSKHEDWTSSLTRMFNIDIKISIKSWDKTKNSIYMYSFIEDSKKANNIFNTIKNNTNVRFVSGLLREMDRDRHFLGFYVVADNVKGCVAHSLVGTNSIAYFLPIVYGEDNFFCASNPSDLCKIWANLENYNTLMDEPIIFFEPFNIILPYFRYLNIYSEIINDPKANRAFCSLMASRYFLTRKEEDKNYARILSGFQDKNEFDKYFRIGQRSSQWLNSTLNRINTEKTDDKNNFMILNKNGNSVDSLE